SSAVAGDFCVGQAHRRHLHPLAELCPAAHARAFEQPAACNRDFTDCTCLHRGRWIGAVCCVSCCHSINRNWGGGTLGSNRRRATYQRLVSATSAAMQHATCPSPLGPKHRNRRCAGLGYSITSSAMASSVGGSSIPSTFAALRLITRSNLVD